MRVNRVLVARSLLATALVVALFFAGQPPAKAAIVIGALLLLTRRVKSARVYAEIDWSLLLMFAGLFIIVAGAERELLTPPGRRGRRRGCTWTRCRCSARSRRCCRTWSATCRPCC